MDGGWRNEAEKLRHSNAGIVDMGYYNVPRDGKSVEKDDGQDEGEVA